MMQLADQQDAETSDSEQDADQKEYVLKYAVSPFFDNAPPQASACGLSASGTGQ